MENVVGRGGERIQKMLSKCIIEMDSFESIQTLAGVDVSYKGGTASAACVLMTEGSVIQEKVVTGKPSFPYVSSFFALREFPLLYQVLRDVESEFDLLFVHGHGRAHPRRFGLACHVGLYFQKPTIGVAGSRLVGNYNQDFNRWTYLYHKKDIVGAVLHTHKRMNPVFISVGHMISLQSAIQLTFAHVKTHKFPEPLNLAHLASKRGLTNRVCNHKTP